MANQLRPCPRCGHLINPQGACHYCAQVGRTPAQVPAPPKPQPWGGIGLGTVALIVALGLFRLLGDGLLSTPSEQVFTAAVSCPADAEYTGSLIVMDARGRTNSRSIEGSGAASYPIGTGTYGGALFQKKSPGPWTLSVEIRKDGKAAQTGNTSAEFGIVNLSDTQ